MTALDRYIDLEVQMLFLESVEDSQGADEVRDEMDSVWAELTPEDRSFLDGRECTITRRLEKIC